MKSTITSRIPFSSPPNTGGALDDAWIRVESHNSRILNYSRGSVLFFWRHKVNTIIFY